MESTAIQNFPKPWRRISTSNHASSSAERSDRIPDQAYQCLPKGHDDTGAVSFFETIDPVTERRYAP
jgi:hypothetical protein